MPRHTLPHRQAPAAPASRAAAALLTRPHSAWLAWAAWPAWAAPVGLASLLAVPLVLPAAHGIGSAIVAALDGSRLAGGGSLAPNGRVLGLLANGLLLALLSALVATALAALCALALLLPHGRRWRLGLAATLAGSFCFGTVVHLMAWRTVFPGISGDAAGWALAVAVLSLRYAPLAVGLLAAGLATLDRAELETALCCGGGAALWTVARRRLLRLAGLSAAAVGALVFGESELPPLVGVHVYAEEFLSQVALEPSAATAAALGWPLMAVAGGCALLMVGVPRLRAGSGGTVSLGWIGQWPDAPRWMRRLVPPVAWLLAALPLLLLAWGSLNASGRWPAHAGAALFSSLWVAVVSAALAVAWAWGLAALALRAGAAMVGTLNLLLWLLVLWPSALTGIALVGWGMPAWAGEAAPLVLAHALRVLPFALCVLLAMRDVQPPGPREQLSVLGARGWAALRHVHGPAALPGLLAAFVLCCGLSLAELTATVLTVPPGMETVILRLYNLMHYGDQRGVLMLALLQGLLVAAAVGLALAANGGRRAGS